jgi:hypothetical protein
MTTDDLPLTELQLRVAEMILATPAPGKHAARSAVSHIKKSWAIRAIDKEMSAFRAITGEEESVTALFHSLKRLKYSNAEKLDPRNHVHKAAMHSFLAAIENNLHLAELNQLKPALQVDVSQEVPIFKTRITLTYSSGEQIALYPVPPLNFTMDHEGKPYDFTDELLELTKQPNLDKVYRHVRHLANRRNQLLYASHEGVPSIPDLPDSFILARRDRVFRNLTLYLLIDPFEVQPFVQQVLDAFLKLLRLLPRELEAQES